MKHDHCKIRHLPVAVFFLCSVPYFAGAQHTISESDSLKQKDLVEVTRSIFHIRSKKTSTGEKKVFFSFLPFGSQGPGGGNVFMTSTTVGFYLGERTKTSLSAFTFSPYLTFDGRFGYTFRSSLWLKNDEWNIKGDTRFLFYPQYTWGLGSNSSEQNRVLINYNYIRFYQTFLRKIKPYFLVGIGYHIDYHTDIETLNDSISLKKFTGYSYGTSPDKNSFSSGLSVNLLYDGQKNLFNPLPGYYWNVVYRFNPKFLGSNYYWHSLYADLRRYISFARQGQNMIAFWAFYWTALNNHVPYLDLPSIGWDPYRQRSGRGFDQNRYRGNGLLYFESEYRKDILENGLLGYVLFANINSVSMPVTNAFGAPHIGAGGGLRIKFNKNSGTNIALDYGFSKDHSGLSINLGETF